MYTIRDGSGDERLSSTSFYIFASRLSSRSVIRTRLPSIIHFYPIQRFLYIRTYITGVQRIQAYVPSCTTVARLVFVVSRHCLCAKISNAISKVSRLHRHRCRHRHKDKYTRGRIGGKMLMSSLSMLYGLGDVLCPMPYTIIHTYGVHGDWEASSTSQRDWRDSVQRWQRWNASQTHRRGSRRDRVAYFAKILSNSRNAREKFVRNTDSSVSTRSWNRYRAHCFLTRILEIFVCKWMTKQ